MVEGNSSASVGKNAHGAAHQCSARLVAERILTNLMTDARDNALMRTRVEATP